MHTPLKIQISWIIIGMAIETFGTAIYLATGEQPLSIRETLVKGLMLLGILTAIQLAWKVLKTCREWTIASRE